MSNKKRKLDNDTTTAAKKKRAIGAEQKPPRSTTERQSQATTSLVQDDIDFPRGGGTSLTALEVKTVRAEAVKEANDEMFKDQQAERSKKIKAKRRKSEVKGVSSEKKENEGDTIRVEHLNYKRVNPGMKIVGQIAGIRPLGLIVSLPNQLLGHVPITQISSQLTTLLEAMDEDEEEDEKSSDSGSDDKSPSKPQIPELFEMFSLGQYVRCIVTAVHASGSSEGAALLRGRGELERNSRRVELSLVPALVNAGVAKADLKPGFTVTAAVKSVEDHGYILDLGVSEVTGFLSFDDAKRGPWKQHDRLPVGYLVDASVTKMSKNNRTCTMSVATESFVSNSMSEVSSVTSVLPGSLVQALITAVLPAGLNLQVLGYFQGTIDLAHLPSSEPQSTYEVGKKIKARVLYELNGTSPPRFALSLADHVLALSASGADRTSSEAVERTSDFTDAYPIGTILDAVKVIRVEPEHGLHVEISENILGFVHISQTSDDHVAELAATSGPWRVNTIHRARVTGYIPFDGLLQLSLKPSILSRRFLNVSDVHVGELVRGTIKKLTEAGLFVEMQGNVDGVVWPNHYADIALKHPQKRFKQGGTIKCRVLVVDPERNRISLTAKKTLVESTLPIIAKLEEAKVGMVTHGVVSKVLQGSIQVEFYNNIRAVVPARETSDTAPGDLSTSFTVGKPVKVRIISLDSERSRIVASIRQALESAQATAVDIAGVEISDVVSGAVTEVHKDNAVLTLRDSGVRALLSLANLAHRRGVVLPQLRASLKPGESIEDLVVVSRNPDKGIVIVANQPKSKRKQAITMETSLTMASVNVGDIVDGKVLKHTRKGTLVKLSNHLDGLLHPTDASDNYDEAVPFPAVDTDIKASVLAIDRRHKQLVLSMRVSRLGGHVSTDIRDPEVQSFSDLVAGRAVRGFIKSITDHGLYVTIGRDIDARVQIRELFDEYVKEWKARFQEHQIVQGRILSLDIGKKQVEMSFRSEDAVRRQQSTLTYTDLKTGQKISGRVRKVEDYGVFIQIEDSKLSGLCHKSEISDNPDANVSLALKRFQEGDEVKAVVLSVDLEKRRISLGLKPSYFDEADFMEVIDDVPEDGKERLDVTSDNDVAHDMDEDIADDGSDDLHDDDNSNSHSDNEDAMQVDTTELAGVLHRQGTIHASAQQSAKSTEVPPSIQLHGFEWFAKKSTAADADPSASSSDESDQEDSTKKRKRRRKQIEQDLTADLQAKTPESNADFERVLLGSPNSSYLWIQYMSFLLQLSEVDKAREIGRRALRTINFREEQEKLNVWIALLNLENVYGSDESLEAVFKDAARSNDSKTVHLRLAGILDQSGKLEKAEEQYKRTSKKFGQSSKVWTLYGEHYLRRGELEQARKLLPRGLQSLEKRKHLKTISKFAQMEYKLGDPERGKTIFEGIVESHPKRWDLWSVYMDMEAGQSNIQSLRNLFDRVLALKMTSHKAKAFFKKWLEFERTLGDEEGAENVKAKAVEWTQRVARGDEA